MVVDNFNDLKPNKLIWVLGFLNWTNKMTALIWSAASEFMRNKLVIKWYGNNHGRNTVLRIFETVSRWGAFLKGKFKNKIEHSKSASEALLNKKHAKLAAYNLYNDKETNDFIQGIYSKTDKNSPTHARTSDVEAIVKYNFTKNDSEMTQKRLIIFHDLKKKQYFANFAAKVVNKVSPHLPKLQKVKFD